jgi:hypothetical protein
VTTTRIPSMLVDDVELRVYPSKEDPSSCAHRWEAGLVRGRASCDRCGAFARWANDPRLEAAP